jgi:hypothetical protein
VVIAAALAVAIGPWKIAASEDEMVPFEVRLEGFADPTFNPDGSISNTETALGQATHLGLVTWASEELAVFTGPNELKVKGTFTLTGANGDKVFGRYRTIGTVTFPFGEFKGPFVITGGTGRFANATGGGTIRGLGRLEPPFEIVGSLSGTISPPGP